MVLGPWEYFHTIEGFLSPAIVRRNTNGLICLGVYNLDGDFKSLENIEWGICCARSSARWVMESDSDESWNLDEVYKEVHPYCVSYKLLSGFNSKSVGAIPKV